MVVGEQREFGDFDCDGFQNGNPQINRLISELGDQEHRHELQQSLKARLKNRLKDKQLVFDELGLKPRQKLVRGGIDDEDVVANALDFLNQPRQGGHER